jgi:TIR domain
MSSLADLPELIGFFSYSREDDEGSHGALSTLRERIQHELRAQLGRSFKNFRLWQDKEAIPSGTLWESEIKNAVAQSVFFIPIITPTVVASPYCRFELESGSNKQSVNCNTVPIAKNAQVRAGNQPQDCEGAARPSSASPRKLTSGPNEKLVAMGQTATYASIQ